MGAVFQATDFPASTEQILKDKFAEHCSMLLIDHGYDSYSGHMGKSPLMITSMQFKDESAAYEWLQDNTEKGGYAKAVKVGEFTKIFPQTEADKKTYKALIETQFEIKDWDANIVKRAKSAKSLQKTCEKCKSKVTVSFIKDNCCPVCKNSNFIQTETDSKKLKSLIEKNKDLNIKYSDAKKKHDAKIKSGFWLVGALCRS